MYFIDKQTYDCIISMCDLSLKTGGLQNKPAVDFIMSKFKMEDTNVKVMGDPENISSEA